MTNDDAQEGIRALFAEVLAVATGEIREWQTTIPGELLDLKEVQTFSEADVADFRPGIVLTFADGTSYHLEILRAD